MAPNTLVECRTCSLPLGGRREESASGETFTSVSHSTYDVPEEIAKAGIEDVKRAVAEAVMDDG